MNQRERYVATLTFGTPDKIPFSPGGPRESTLARWYKEGLPEDANWFEFLCETIGIGLEPTSRSEGVGASFGLIPQYEEKVLEHKDGHYIVQDYKGNICEISDKFDVTYLRSAKDFCTRRWIKCPVENRDDWEQMKARYDIDSPGRFREDFADRCAKLADREVPAGFGTHGPFWQMREWCGFEGLCIMMIDQPDLVADMAAFWTDFVMRMIDRILAHVTPDFAHYSEDMAYKAKAMISPAMCRQFLMPSWKAWSAKILAAGVPIIDMDSDGFIGELIPLWIESGINACDPIEVAALNDINEFRKQFGREMAYTGGVDKRCIAKGGKVIRDELKRIEPVVKDGGFIPGCDHGVPSDISWGDYVDYCRLLAQMTGWL